MRYTLFLLLLAASALQALPIENCGSGVYVHRADICGDGTEDCCPATLSGLSLSNADGSTFDFDITTNKGQDRDGNTTLTCAAYLSTDPAPDRDDVTACTGSCVANDDVTISASGATSGEVTGLPSGETFRAACTHPWDDQDTHTVLLSTGTISTSGGSTDLSGTGSFVDCSSGSDANNGTTDALAWLTMAHAESQMSASDNIYVKSGTTCDMNEDPFNLPGGTGVDPFVLQCYYMDGATPRACSGQTRPVLHDVTGYVIRAESVDWNIIDGIEIDGQATPPAADVNSYILFDNSDNNVVRNSRFERGNGWGGISIAGTSSNNIIEDNEGENHGEADNGDPTQPDTGDFIAIFSNASNNIIRRNTFSKAGHTILNIEGSNNQVISNTFDQDQGGGVGNHVLELRVKSNGPAPKGRNLVELNVIKGALNSADTSGLSQQSVKVYGNKNILRFNSIENGVGRALQTSPGSNLREGSENCAYNNDILSHNGEAWRIHEAGETGYEAFGNRFYNNYVESNNVEEIEINMVSNLETGATGWNLTEIKGNAFQESSLSFVVQGEGTFTLPQAENGYPSLVADNASSGAKSSSGGIALTSVTSASSTGTSFDVASGDCLFAGDAITVGTDTLTIESVSGDTIAVTTSFTWAFGDSVSLTSMLSSGDVARGTPASLTAGDQ